MQFGMTKLVRTAKNTRIKMWFLEHGISQRHLATLLDLTPGTINGKLNGWISWTQHDLEVLHREFGLSSDFVIDLSGIEQTQPFLVAEKE